MFAGGEASRSVICVGYFDEGAPQALIQTWKEFERIRNHRASYSSANLSSKSGKPNQIDESEVLTQEGNRLMVAKRYEEAIAAYDRVLKLKANSAYAWQQRGEALRRLQRYADSLDSYHKAIEFSANPISRYQALNARGALFFELQLYEEAISSYNQSLAILPNGMGSPHILKMKGMAMSNLKRYDEAVELFNQAYHKAVEICAKT